MLRSTNSRVNICRLGWALAAVLGVACQSNSDSASLAICRGTAVACSALSSSECASAQGCSEGLCSGTPSACSHNGSLAGCLLQQGCSWDETQHACLGAPVGCASYASAASCVGASGCTWGGGCSGKPAACAALSGGACSAQPGCQLSQGDGTDEFAARDAATRDAATLVCKPPPAASELIDDMEDQTPQLSSSYSQWFTYNDGTPGGHQVPNDNAGFTMESIPGGRCGSRYAMRMTGSGFTDWGAGMGFNFGTGPATEDDPYPAAPSDGSSYDGLRFWARVGDGVATKVRFAINDKNTHPSGGVCPVVIVDSDASAPDADGAGPKLPVDAAASSEAASSEAASSEAASGDAASTDAADAAEVSFADTAADVATAEEASAQTAALDAGAPEAGAGLALANSEAGLIDGGAEAGAAQASDVSVPTSRRKLSLTECYNGFATQLELTSNWVEYRVPFSALAQQPGWGYHAPALLRDQLYSVQFDFTSASAFDLWVDDVSWYRADEP